MRRLGVTCEFDKLILWQAQDLLEPSSNLSKSSLSFVCGSGLSSLSWPDGTSNSSCPKTDSEHSLSDVDDDTHNFSLSFGLKGLSDGSQHDVEPDVVDGAVGFVLELESPLSSVLVLDVFPFWADSGFEKMVIGLLGEFGGLGDIVLLAGKVATVSKHGLWR